MCNVASCCLCLNTLTMHIPINIKKKWISYCCFLNMQSTDLAAEQCMFSLSYRMLWIGPDEITTKLAASRTGILVFWRICSFTWFTFKSLFLVKGCTERSLFSAEVTLLLNLKYTQNSHCLPSNSPFNILKAKFDSYILYFQQSYVVCSSEAGNS
jgi:hypothetical protein